MKVEKIVIILVVLTLIGFGITLFINSAGAVTFLFIGLWVLFLIALLKVKQYRVSNILSFIGLSLLAFSSIWGFLVEQQLPNLYANPVSVFGIIFMALGTLVRTLQNWGKPEH